MLGSSKTVHENRASRTRSHDRLLAMLALALLIGLSGCGDDAADGDAGSASEPSSSATESGVADQAVVDKLLKKAVLQDKAGNAKGAIELVSQIIGNDPGNSRAFKVRADIYAGLRQDANALADYSAAIRIDPQSVRWLNARGFFLFTRGKRDAALRDLDAAIALDGGNSQALNNRGLLRVGQQDFERAIADFSKAIEADAKFADAWNNRGFAHFRSDKHAKALADFDTALACDPKFVMAYNNRALLRIARKEYRQAVADCSSAIELNGDNPRFYQLRREAYRRLGKSKEALADSEKLAWLIKYQRLSRHVASAPLQAGGYIQRARHLAQEGRSGAALADYQRAIKVDPTQANEAYLARARYWIVKKDWKQATVDCSRALEAGGGYAAWSLRGEAHMHQGHWDLAIADFAKARRFDTVVAGVYAKRAAVHESAGRKVEAAADRKRAAELDPERFEKTP